jgi:hypothetical protein
MTVWQNAALGAPNWSDYATWTVKNLAGFDSYHPSFGPTQLTKTQPLDRCQTLDTSEVVIQGAADRARAINMLLLLYCNATGNAGWRVRMATSEAALDSDPFLDTSSYTGDPTKPFEYCVKFDGENGKGIASSIGALSGSFSMELHFRAQVLRQQGLLRVYDGSSSGILSMESDGRLRFEIFDAGGVSLGAVVSTGVTEVFTWTHAACVYDDATNELRLYAHGLPLATTGSVTVGPTLSGSSLVEVAPLRANRGWIDVSNVIVWDEARSDAEILANYDEQIATDPGMLLYYKFNDGSGIGATEEVSAKTLLLSGHAWSYPERLWASPGLDDWDRKHSLWLYGPGFTATHIRINVLDEGNPDGFLTFGRLFGSGAWQPSFNIEYGSGLFGYDDPGSVKTLVSGVSLLDEGSPVPSLPFSIRTTSKDEMIQLSLEMARTRGTTRPVVFVRDPGDPYYAQQGIVYGVLENLSPSIEASYEFYQQRFQIKGLG